MKKRYAIYLVICIFILTSCSFSNYNSSEELNNKQVVDSVNKIVRTYTNISAKCYLVEDKTYLYLNKMNITQEELANKSVNIEIEGGTSLKKNHTPVQVYAIFECFLRLNTKKLPFDLFGMSWSFTSGGIDNTFSQRILIKKTEFDDICSATDIEGLTEGEAAKALGDKWIQKTGYEKK